MPKNSVAVDCFDRFGNLVESFPSVYKAGQFLGISDGNIWAYLQGKYNNSEGLTFKLKSETKIPETVIELLDTEGVANLLDALNAKCSCERDPNYRLTVARRLLKNYRFARKTRMPSNKAAVWARNNTAGVECCEGKLNKWWTKGFSADDVEELRDIVKGQNRRAFLLNKNNNSLLRSRGGFGGWKRFTGVGKQLVIQC